MSKHVNKPKPVAEAPVVEMLPGMCEHRAYPGINCRECEAKEAALATELRAMEAHRKAARAGYRVQKFLSENEKILILARDIDNVWDSEARATAGALLHSLVMREHGRETQNGFSCGSSVAVVLAQAYTHLFSHHMNGITDDEIVRAQETANF